MIPPFPMPLPVLGPTLYGELCLGLCRAFVAPWLDICHPPPRRRREPGGTGKVAEPAAAASAVAPMDVRGASCQVIHVPAARWQQRRGAGAAAD